MSLPPDHTPPRGGRRPPGLTPPTCLSPSPPVPAPSPADPAAQPADPRSPTRYGDWEKKGIAVDF